MIFNTYGNNKNKVILLLHPMFTSKDFFADKIELLAENCFVIIPTLSGHHGDSVYHSMKEEMENIDNFLRESDIKTIDCIAGFSLGGNIAYNYFCTHADSVKYALIDSAPLFKFPQFVKRMFYNKYKKCLLKIKQPDADVAKELDKCFNGMGEKQKDIAPGIDLQSLNGLIESCYDISMYPINHDVQQRLTFVYGSKDIARFCLPRIKKYGGAKIVKLKNYNHCGYFVNNARDYVEKFLNI